MTNATEALAKVKNEINRQSRLIDAPYSDETLSALTALRHSIVANAKNGFNESRLIVELVGELPPLEVVRFVNKTRSLQALHDDGVRLSEATRFNPEQASVGKAVIASVRRVYDIVADKLEEAWNKRSGDDTKSAIVQAMLEHIETATSLDRDSRAEVVARYARVLYPQDSQLSVISDTNKSIERAISDIKFSNKMQERNDNLAVTHLLAECEKRSPGITEKVSTAIAESSARANAHGEKTTRDVDSVFQVHSWFAINENGTKVIGRNPFEGPAVQKTNRIGDVDTSVYMWNGERLGAYKGSEPSDKVLNDVLDNFREADPKAFERCASEFAQKALDEGCMTDLPAPLRDIVQERASMVMAPS